MDCLDRGNTFSTMENRYLRKTPVSRSIKQNGEFLFSTPKRRTPMTPYIPPHRRKNSIDDDSLLFKRSEEKLKPPTPVFDHSNTLNCAKSNFKSEINEKSIKAQEIVIGVSEQESNQEKEFYEESCMEKINEENINQVFHHDVKEKFNRKNDNRNTPHKNYRLNPVEKILKLANNYMNSEFKQMLCDIYFDKYKEKLPKECLTAIKFCISLDLDDSINNFLDLLTHVEENNEENRFLKNKKEETNNKDYGPKESLFCQEEITKPRQLELNDLSEEFWAVIYSCNSITDIKGVIMDSDHLGKVELLADEMKIFYKFEKSQKVIVEENGYYALFDGSWHRVHCIKCDGSNAEVFFIDRGDMDNVSIDRLYKLDKKFFKLPGQAIHMSLLDLETFTDCNGIHEMLDELLFEKTVYVNVKESNEEKNLHLSVQLYISKEDENIDINELMAQKLFKTVLNPLYDIQEGKAEHIISIQTNMAGLFIQLNTTSSKYFKLLMEVLIKKYCYGETFKRQKVVRFEGNQIYFVRRSRDNKFYRAKVLKFKDEKVIEVLLIDTGIVTFINREDFYLLEKLSPILAQYPAQAIRVQLDQITILNSKILDHLEAITIKSNALYVKFTNIEKENNNIPVVHLYKKIHDYLISINDALLLEYCDILQNKSTMTSESKLKLAGGNFDENTPKSEEDNFYDNKPNLSTCNTVEEHFDGSILKTAEDNFDGSILKSAEYNFDLNKSKLSTCNTVEEHFNGSILKSVEDNFNGRILKSAEYNFDINKQQLVENNFNERKSKLVEGNLDEAKTKLAEDNLSEIKQKTTNNYFDELYFKNVEAELERLKLFQADLLKPIEKVEVDCTKLCISALLCAPIVPKDNYFDIHITVAKDPSHFAFQFLKSKSVELRKMIHEMNEVSINYKGPKLTYKSICVGQIYTYRCENNFQMWYRVYLLKIKDKYVATVYFCDYGHYKDVNIENLSCLQNQFYSLPYQAIWAELYGVKPASGYWTEKDCLRFKELIESKNFVCNVRSINNVKALNRNKSVPVTVETIYVVKLIDTSTDEDVYITDILIKDGHALKKNGI